jgi:hypothetical protein
MGESISDWLSYRPSDFLMFAPRTYWRLFELQNGAWWPWHLVALAGGTAGIVAAGRGGAAVQRVVAAGLAAAWAFVAWSFLLVRYAPINWAAMGLAWLFAAQAALLAGLAWQVDLQPCAGVPRRWVAQALGAFALWGYPLLAPLQGRPLAQAEVFGLAPEPTVVATLAWLLATAGRADGHGRWARRAAWAVAVTCSAASAATLATMDEAQAAVLAPATLLAIAFGIRGRAGSA